MRYESIFSLGGLLVLPFWLLMILLPRWGWVKRIVGSPWIVAGPTLLYGFVVLPRAPALLREFGTLGQVAVLLGSPAGATAGWMHFLAFDLFVGRWAWLDGERRGIHPLLMAPVLLLTFLFGPLGLLGYLLLRAAAGRRGWPARA